jgi:hypothetical protein
MFATTAGQRRSIWVTPPAKTVEPMTEYYFEAVKILGTGNAVGLAGAITAYSYFIKSAPNVIGWTTVTAIIFLFGVALFSVAFFCLYKFCVWQVGPRSSEPIAANKVWWWRVWALTFGAWSLGAWWLGVAATVWVIIILPATDSPPLHVHLRGHALVLCTEPSRSRPLASIAQGDVAWITRSTILPTSPTSDDPQPFSV